MNVFSAALSLVTAGFCDSQPCDAHTVDEAAWLVVAACASPDPPARQHAPNGARCVQEVAVLWHLESRFRLYPTDTDRDCGPLQVLAGEYGNRDVGWGMTPTRERLRMPRVGLAWGVLMLRAKQRFKTWRRRAFAYNGSKRAASYAEKAVKRLRVLRRRLR